MSLSWEFSGGQFTSLANSMATVTLATKALGKVEVVDTSSVASPRATAAAETSSGTQTSGNPASGSNFVLTYAKSTGNPQFTYTLTGTVNGGSRESVTIVPTIQNDGPATDSIHYCSIEFELLPFGPADENLVMLPGPQSSVYPWNQITTSEAKWCHPGLIDRGGEHPLNPSGDSGLNESDEPSGDAYAASASFVQWAYVWNEVNKQGVLFRSTDAIGQGKIISIQRDATSGNLRVIWRFIPPDHSTGSSGASDHAFAYGLEIRPMTGEDYDALVYVRERQVAEGHPAYAKGTIRDRVTGGTYRAWTMNAFYALSGGGGSVGFDYDQYVDNVTNLKNYFGLTAGELVGTFYGFESSDLGDYAPTVDFDTGAGAAIQSIYDLGIGVLLYTIPIHNGVWDAVGSTGLPPAQAINDDLSLDRTDTAITGETPNVGADSGGTIYIAPSWLDDLATDALYNYINAQLQAGASTKYNGIYDDAGNAFAPPPADTTTLTSNDRGIGSTTWWPKNRNRFDLWRTALSDDGISNAIVASEHPNEMSVGWIDFFFDNCVGPTTFQDESHGLQLVTAKLPSAIMWSEYTRMTSFYGFGDGPDPTDFAGYAVADYATVAEIFASVYSFEFHRGLMPSFLRYFQNSSNLYFDTGYGQQYGEWGQFVKRLWFNQDDKVKHWHTCRRLRETPSSPLRRMRTAIKQGSADVMLVDANKLHSSVWHDTDNDYIGIFLSNWSLQGGNPVSVTFSDTLTSDDYPELDSTKRNVFKTDLETGVRTFIGTYDGGGSYTPNITLDSGQALLLEMVPTVIYYIDSDNGNDTTGDGSEASPYATIGKATSLWSAGETIALVGGKNYTITETITMLEGSVLMQSDYPTATSPNITAAGGAFPCITIDGITCTVQHVTTTLAGTSNSGVYFDNDCSGTVVEMVTSLLNNGSGFQFGATASGTVTIRYCAAVANTGMGYDINGSVALTMNSCHSQSNTSNGYAVSNTAALTGTGLVGYFDGGVGMLFDGTGTHTLSDIKLTNIIGFPISITAACTVGANRVVADMSAARGWSVQTGTLNIRNSYLTIHNDATTGGGGLYVGASGTAACLNCCIVNFSDAAIPNVYTATTATGITLYNLVSVASGTSSVHVDGNASGATVDTNTYYPDGAAKFVSSSVAFSANFAGWQAAATPVDANSQVGDPKLRAPSDGIPSLSHCKLRRGSAASGFGTNLQAFFTDSASGAARPTAGAWDSGPHVYSASDFGSGMRRRSVNGGIRL